MDSLGLLSSYHPDPIWATPIWATVNKSYPSFSPPLFKYSSTSCWPFPVLQTFTRASFCLRFVRRIDMISPLPAVSHSLPITNRSAKNESSSISRKKVRAQTAFGSLGECVHLGLAQNSIWQEWITQVLKNSQEISWEIYSCLPQFHSLSGFLLTSAAHIDGA